MKIIAWNVNGLRSLLKTNNLEKLIESENPDVLCMGETKLSCSNHTSTHSFNEKKDENYESIDEEIKTKFPKFKFRYWSPCKTRGGYSGTAIFCKKEPQSVHYGLPHKNKDLDDEGRVIVIEYPKFYILHVYTPNSGQALARLDFRTETWDRAFENYIKKLQETKPIIVCGDLNVAHKEIDLKNPKTNLRTAGYTIEERESFEKILKNVELIDSFRYKNPELIMYSYWSYMRKSREKNIGWRIDYFLLSTQLKTKCKESSILTQIEGSDHAPILLKI